MMGRAQSVLVVNIAVPFPPVGGGPTRTSHLVRALTKHFDVTLAGFTFGDRPVEAPPFPVEIVAVPWEEPELYRKMKSADPAVAGAASEILSEVSNEPWFVSFYDSPAMEEALRRILSRKFDLILLEDTDSARFLPLLPPDVPKILDLHNVYSRMARREGSEREFARTVAFESRVARACRAVITCSEVEAREAERLLGIQRPLVIPNGVDTAYFAPCGQAGAEDGLLFTGSMGYAPNVDAALWFTKEILPLIHRRLPGVKFHLVGKDPGPDIMALASDSVRVHGFVPDMRPYLRGAAIVVTPIRKGGGTRLKLLEAAASGKAIISTEFGAEGLAFEAGKSIEFANSPETFAEYVVNLYRDSARRDIMGIEARRVASAYDWNQIKRKFLELVMGYGGVPLCKGALS